MSDPMAEISLSFFIECDELLEGLQDALQTMEDGDCSSESINVAFRAVHSIKGGAGAFGLDALVSFAHIFETVMDEVRSGQLQVDQQVLGLFFQSSDMLSDLVKASRDEVPVPEDRILLLVEQLEELSGAETDVEEPVDFHPMRIPLDLPGMDGLPDIRMDGLPDLDDPKPAGAEAESERAGEAESADATRTFCITFTPHYELYTSGNEPLFLIRALSELGTPRVECRPGKIPDLTDYNAEKSFLSWVIRLETNADVAEIRETFEFVDSLCDLLVEAENTPGPRTGEIPAEESPAAETIVAEDAPEPVAAGGPAQVPGVDATTEAPAPETDAAPPPYAPKNAPPAAQQQPKISPTVRVDLDRIDRLVNLVGELVINQAMLSQSVSASGLSGNTKIATGLDEFQQLTRDIQDSVMMIRAQPVKSLFQRMGRIVREASAAVGKTVRLKTDGETTEIDKTVIERLGDPLTHMIRNAVDHGLESTQDRIAAGKPEAGRITLSATHRSGRVVIEVRDDGGGIDRPRVRQKAVERGLISAEQDLTDVEIDNMLFLPGFSTASEVSNLSGRGVGMDVVKSAISGLGGRISITSSPGVGTTFSISLPLTLAVLDGMVVRVGSETLVMPLNAIFETLSLKSGDARSLGPRTQVIRFRDTFVPLIDLGTELGYGSPRRDYDGATVLLIAQEDGRRAALVVDEIEDQRQVVIKGLHDSYGHVPGVAAATILGDGQIALILDPGDLLATASGLSRPNDTLACIA